MGTNLPGLTGDTLWRLSLTLRRPGSKDNEAIARMRFVQDRNYEPPQGKIYIEDDLNGFIIADDKGYSGTWSLSEDKNDRKDGLWIWGRQLDIHHSYVVDIDVIAGYNIKSH